MAEKNMNARIQMKGDTLANWQKATGFVPLDNEFLLVTDTGGTLRGDGQTTAAVLAGANGADIKYFQVPADELISVDDIDAICGTVIQDASSGYEEVTF